MHCKIRHMPALSRSLALIMLSMGLLLLWTAHAQAAGKSNPASADKSCEFPGLPSKCPESPVGLWHLNVDFPQMPPFLEIMLFHEGGTLSESNFLLHGNSANPMFPFNGGEGFGIWEIDDDGITRFAFQKMVYNAEDNNAPVGFLRVKGSAILDGGIWQDIESNTSLVTPGGAVIANFGQPNVTGLRLSLDTID